MCSSTPRVRTPASRAGATTRAAASASTASQQVCQSTPEMTGQRGHAATHWPALMQLRYGGSAGRWGFALYLTSTDGYQD